MNNKFLCYSRMLAMQFFAFIVPGYSFAQSYVVGDLMGQFGNQLFIIAATVSLALDHGATPVFPDLSNNPNDNIPFNYERIFSHLNTEVPKGVIFESTYREPCYHYVPIPYTGNMKLFGYFQSEKYFVGHKEEIIKLFSAPQSISDYLEEHYSYILSHPKTVAIHLRSYYPQDPEEHIHITYGREYVEKAMRYFSTDSLFVVFSNDIPWCKFILSDFQRPIIFIEDAPDYHHEFYLMSLCKHHIISNSSFSWWAAYLNPNPFKIVVTPQDWFNPNAIADTQDIRPPCWEVVRGD